MLRLNDDQRLGREKSSAGISSNVNEQLPLNVSRCSGPRAEVDLFLCDCNYYGGRMDSYPRRFIQGVSAARRRLANRTEG